MKSAARNLAVLAVVLAPCVAKADPVADTAYWLTQPVRGALQAILPPTDNHAWRPAPAAGQDAAAICAQNPRPPSCQPAR